MKKMQLQINNVSKQYKNKIALYPFSLLAKEGECIALCGGNGAGKTTLLHIIAGISKSSAGTVKIGDIDLLKDRKAYVSQIGYMPDEFFAQETMTVTEFLRFYASMRKVPFSSVTDLVQLLGLEEKKGELLKNLSKGMRQRLLFGQALVGLPHVLILDEPTNGLDPNWINAFIKILKNYKGKGTTVVFSTHMMDVAAEIADRVIFMDNGKQVDTLINDFTNTAEFMDKLLQLYRKQEHSIHNRF